MSNETIKLKAFVVIAPGCVYPQKENLFIGGVASSIASEQAAEEGGFVVELSGSYPKEEVFKMYESHIEDAKYQIDNGFGDPKIWHEHLAELQRQLHAYRTAPESAFTNPVHVSK